MLLTYYLGADLQHFIVYMQSKLASVHFCVAYNALYAAPSLKYLSSISHSAIFFLLLQQPIDRFHFYIVSNEFMILLMFLLT